MNPQAGTRMWRKCLALLSGFVLGKHFIIQVNCSVEARASTPVDVFFSNDELDVKRIFSMWIRGCKKQMNSLKVKTVRGAQEESWSGAREGARALGWFIL